MNDIILVASMSWKLKLPCFLELYRTTK